MKPLDLNDFASEKAELKYGAAKRAVDLSKESPAALYPHLDFFIDLLDGENRTLKWAAILVIGNLSGVARHRDAEPVLPRFTKFLKSGQYMTANYTITALAQIGHNKPEYGKKIANELLKVEKYQFETEELENFIIGKVISALGQLDWSIQDDPKVLNFLKRQSENSRKATRDKARALLRKVQKRENVLEMS